MSTYPARVTLMFVLVGLGLAACGFPPLIRGRDDGGSEPDDGSGPDGDDDGGGIDMEIPVYGFQIQSPDVVVEAGQENTFCYYFRTPNTEPMAIRKWTSSMTGANAEVILFTTPNEVMPPGTIVQANCGFSTAGAIKTWTYAAHTEQAQLELPSDDGGGTPLGQLIPPNTAGFLAMHHLNTTANAITAHVTINAEALDAGAAYTQTAAYVTYNGALSIPPGGSLVAARTCVTPASAKFWLMSMQTHKQATKLEVRNGTTSSTDVVFTSSDWANPGARTWLQAPFYTFANAAAPNNLTFECTYTNTTSATITSGDSWQSNEVCVAVGFWFPATTSIGCFCTGAGCNLL
jgi:hypothetical protein